jgi:hypothetical protein
MGHYTAAAGSADGREGTMRLPDLGKGFFVALGLLWAAFAVPAHLVLTEATSITAAAYRERKLVTAKITAQRRSRGGGRLFDVDFPPTYGMSACRVHATSDEVATWTSNEIGVYVIPDTPIDCATAGTLPSHAPRTPQEDVLAASLLALALSLSITSFAWWIRARRRSRHAGTLIRKVDLG